jgi:uncharacterized protein YkwD
MLLRSITAAAATLALLASAGGSAAAQSPSSLLAPESACPGQSRTADPESVQEATMLCMHNYARRQAGLRRLRTAAKLTGAAERKAADIGRCHDYSHSACGRDPFHWERRMGYMRPCSSAGENIDWNPAEFASVRETMLAWLSSSEHRRNILYAPFRDIGVGLVKGESVGLGDELIWVAQFGRRC